MPSATEDGRQGRVPAGCVFWMHGAKRAFTTVPEDHGNCSIGPEEMTCAPLATQLDSIVAALEKTSGIDATVGRYAAEDARRFAVLGS